MGEFLDFFWISLDFPSLKICHSKPGIAVTAGKKVYDISRDWSSITGRGGGLQNGRGGGEGM